MKYGAPSVEDQQIEMTALEEMNEEMYAILQDKLEGEAYKKANSVKEGEGLHAYIRMHQWFNQATDLGTTQRRINVMKPNQCKHEWEVASAVEAWEREHEIMQQEDEPLPDVYQMTAIKCILAGDIKKHVELREEELDNMKRLRHCIMTWAVNKRIEKGERKCTDGIGRSGASTRQAGMANAIGE